MLKQAAMPAGMQEQRPVAKTALPIRAEANVNRGVPCVDLVYDGHVMTPAGEKVLPFRTSVDPANKFDNPLALAVLVIVRTYHDLESQLDGLIKQRDDAVSRALMAEASVDRLTERVHNMEAEKERRARKV